MDNLKMFSSMGSEENWRTPTFRQGVVSKIEEVIQRSGMQVARNSSEMENHVFNKAKTREEYMNMVAKLILHVREMSAQPKQNQGQAMQGPNQNQAGPNPQQNQQPNQQGPSQPGLAPDPINALQNLASQGTRNQMMNIGPQGQMQQQGVMGPNPGMMQGQMGQQTIVSQGQPQTATNLLQTLNQRPQLNMLQGKLQGAMGMMLPGMEDRWVSRLVSQGQPQTATKSSSDSTSGRSSICCREATGHYGAKPATNGRYGHVEHEPHGGQLQGQLGPGMQGQMMANMPMGAGMQGLGAGMQCQPGMQGQVQGQMQGQMVGGMGNNPMVNSHMMHMRPKQDVGMVGYRQPPGQFLRQSPSPSAPSPNMPQPSPVSMQGVMGGALPSPIGLSGLGACGGVGAGSPSSHMQHHAPQQRVSMGMVASPSSSLNTPVGASVASPSNEDAAYRDKVRQLSKYIEPLRRMVHRMVSEGENVEKLTKMKNLLDILSNPNKRMPLETLIKCEVVLEKLDFKRGDGLGVPASGKEQIFNPLLEVVNNCLSSPLANHTLKRTFGSTLDALNGPEIKNLPPPLKVPKIEEPAMEIPDVLQGEIARLDSRFKVSLETMQLAGGNGAISLVAMLDDARLPCVPSVLLSVPRGYPARPPARLRPKHGKHDKHEFLARVEQAMDARVARLPKSCSVGQLLDAWEMSVRQACAPNPVSYTPVPPLGL
ncbi:mediator of RNA polymerase II transcription subunit 15 [Leguminivora glycinivorella]|uniref:mediator of RNA polymerase II transcription subunit 15 n=1 Tax=Leguminivora glycinivorella TaxID=1035111 RepID=UPI0020108334|nr:mediator of RNA polymerase II transcription subunit 15 [Leguminivora glycinivorella]